jgi:hypothetical protein
LGNRGLIGKTVGASEMVFGYIVLRKFRIGHLGVFTHTENEFLLSRGNMELTAEKRIYRS